MLLKNVTRKKNLWVLMNGLGGKGGPLDLKMRGTPPIGTERLS